MSEQTNYFHLWQTVLYHLPHHILLSFSSVELLHTVSRLVVKEQNENPH